MKSLFPAGVLGAAVFLTISGLTGGPASSQGAPSMQNSPSPVPPAASVQAGSLVITEPWSRATPGGARVGGGYLRITNTGSAPDRLTGGSFALAGRVEVHQMSMAGDVMRMAPVVGGLVVAPGETVELKPGGFHLMFMDLREPLKEGQAVTGTLVFERAGPVAVSFAVRGIGGAGGPAAATH
jgi:copper(I)-binding protein